MTLLQQWLKEYAVVAQYEQVIYSVLLIVLMLVRPQGLFGTRELWDLPLFRRVPWRRLGVKAAATGGTSPTEVRDDEVGGAR